MRRPLLAVLALVLALSAGSLAGCQRKVEVQTGERVMCTYGHEVSDSVRTIEVPSKDAAKYRVKEKTIVCDKHRKLEALYAQAQSALAAGDLTTAKEKLAAVVAGDAGFKSAASQLDAINAGKSPTSDKGSSGSGGTKNPTSTPDPGVTPNGALAAWVPDAITGYTARKAANDALSVTRQYLPAGNADVVQLVISAEQFRTGADAQKALTSQVKQRYPKDAATFKVNGHDVYFGTDGRRFAVVGFTDASVMVAVEMAAVKSGSPDSLKSAITEVVKQLP